MRFENGEIRVIKRESKMMVDKRRERERKREREREIIHVTTMSQVVKESRATMTAKLKRAKLPVPLKITHCHISSLGIIFKKKKVKLLIIFYVMS